MEHNRRSTDPYNHMDRVVYALAGVTGLLSGLVIVALFVFAVATLMGY